MSTVSRPKKQNRNDSSSDSQGRSLSISRNATPGEAASEYLKAYAQERPEMVALWAFGVGFVLGWKLKFF